MSSTAIRMQARQKTRNPVYLRHNQLPFATNSTGGYNALELMRYKRTYTQGANLKGQLEKPMKQTHDWIYNLIRGGS